MVAAVVSAVGVAVGAIQAAGLVHVEGRRRGIGVDYLAGRVHGARMMVHGMVGVMVRVAVMRAAGGHPVGGDLVVVAGRGGQLLLLLLLAGRRAGGGGGGGGGYLGEGRRVRAGGVMQAAVGHVGHMRLWAGWSWNELLLSLSTTFL